MQSMSASYGPSTPCIPNLSGTCLDLAGWWTCTTCGVGGVRPSASAEGVGRNGCQLTCHTASENTDDHIVTVVDIALVLFSPAQHDGDDNGISADPTGKAWSRIGVGTTGTNLTCFFVSKPLHICLCILVAHSTLVFQVTLHTVLAGRTYVCDSCLGFYRSLLAQHISRDLSSSERQRSWASYFRDVLALTYLCDCFRRLLHRSADSGPAFTGKGDCTSPLQD